MEREELIIKVSLTPHPHDNVSQPYFWSIQIYEDGWYNWGSGWSDTPKAAFHDAVSYIDNKTGMTIS